MDTQERDTPHWSDASVPPQPEPARASQPEPAGRGGVAKTREKLICWGTGGDGAARCLGDGAWGRGGEGEWKDGREGGSEGGREEGTEGGREMG